MDDVINVSGHRIGTAEVEGALTQHPKCAEAAVVPVEHPIKGQGIYAFVTLMVVRYGPQQRSHTPVVLSGSKPSHLLPLACHVLLIMSSTMPRLIGHSTSVA